MICTIFGNPETSTNGTPGKQKKGERRKTKTAEAKPCVVRVIRW